MDITKIVRTGNSNYVKISVAYMDRFNMKKGDYVTVEYKYEGLLIKPLKIAEEVQDEKEQY